tara:strand:+ start:128 stop:322 length:195 start_codon:yes stop_codon:yes gene_type:complete
MFLKIKNFICKLFNIKACQCDEDEHIEFFTKVPEPDIPVHEENPTHCKDHTRFRKSCPQCVALT